MGTFQSKRGENGWPNPQAKQIEGWCKRFDIDCDKHFAQTGTIYLTLSSSDEEITVRCADHADAHCAATHTVDPAIDQRNAVKAWIKENGDESSTKTKSSAKAKCTRLMKARPWLLWGDEVAPVALYKPSSIDSKTSDWQQFSERLEAHGKTNKEAIPLLAAQLKTTPDFVAYAKWLERAKTGTA